MKNQSLTIQDAAKFLGLSTKTLRRWDASGRFKPERTVGNQRRYSMEELVAFKATKANVLENQEQRIKNKEVVVENFESRTENLEPVATEVTVLPLNPSPAIEAAAVLEEISAPQVSPVREKSEAEQAQAPVQESVSSPVFTPSNFHATEPENDQPQGLLQKVKAFFRRDGERASVLAFALAGMIIFVSLAVVGWAHGRGMGGGYMASVNGAGVLAAKDSNPVFELKVNVPAVFGQKATFLDSIAIKKSLNVEGLSTLSGGITTNNADINAGTGQLTASNVVYSITSGSNITITGDPQNPTISANASGVTSFQGQTGELSLTNGSGIGLSGLTITNSDPGSAQKIFGTFSVEGASIQAGSNTDTITFAAGSGVTLTPNTTDKSITISANSGVTTQWTTTGSDIYYNAGNVGIGNTSPGDTLDVTGTGRFSGALTVSSLGTGVVKSDANGLLSSSAIGLGTADVTGTLGIGNGGTGVTAIPTNGQVLIGNGSGYTLSTLTAGSGIGIANGSGTISITNNGVLSITGTANQINASGSTGAITLSLPQNIATTSTPSFTSLSLTANTNQLTLGTGNTGVISLGTLSTGRTYTLPDASGEICLDSGNCPSGGGGNISGSGTGNYLAKFTSASTIANSLLYDSGGGIGIGTTSPQGLFSVSGGAPGVSLVSLNETGDQNILVGSASGTTRFIFDRSGNLSLNGGGLQFNGTNILSGSTLGSSITASSLTSVGTLASGSISSGFGAIDIGTDDISAGNITATGATGLTVTGNGAGLTFSGTGNHIISASSGTLQFGAATLTGNITGNSQDIIGLDALSASGTITFSGLSTGVVKSNGSGVLSSSAVGLNTADVTGTLGVGNGGIGLSSFVTGDIIYASGANTLAARSIGSTGQILTVQGGVPVWADAGGTINFWQRNAGTVSPLSITDDLLVGGNATSSAKFQIFGTTGNASTSGSLTFSTASSIQTTANQTLTIGGNTTGNITLSPLNGNGSVISTGDLNVASGKGYQINGATVLTATALGSSVVGSSLTSVDALTSGSIGSGFGTIATANTITGTTLNGTTGINTGAGAGTQRIDASGNLVNIGTINASGALTFGNYTTNNGLLYTNGSGVVQQAGAGTSGQILIANGSGLPTFVTLGTDATLDATGALTIAANAVALGADTTGNYVASITGGNGIGVTGSAGEGWTPSLALSALTADWDQTGGFDIILNNASSELQIKESAGNTYFGTIDVGDLSQNRTYTFPDSTGTICLVEAGNCAGSGTGVTTAGGTADRLVKFTGAQAVGDASIRDLYTSGVALTIDTLGRLGIGTTSPAGMLSVTGGTFGGNAALIVNQTGASSNDLITASASGTTRFIVSNNGNVQFAGNTSFINTLTSLATQNRTYTLPDATGTICLVEAGNCAGSGGGLTGSGTVGQIPYFDTTGSLTSESSGFAWDATNNRLGIGNDTPVGKLDVTGANLGKALAIFNETGDQNILTGSASGTTRFVFDRSGNLNLIGGGYQISGTTVLNGTALGSGVTGSSLTQVGALTSGSIANGFGTIATGNTITGTTLNGTTGINTGAGAGTVRIDANGNLSNIGTINASGSLTFSNYTTNGGILYTNGSGVVGQTTAGSSGQVLVSNAGGAPSWVDANTLGTNYWQRNAGAVSPLNITDDLLVGGIATSSAKFQIFGTTGNATTAGTLTFSTASSIQTTANQTLTIGGNTTGNITLSPLNGSGVVTSTGDLNVASGKGYQINGANVLTATALGSGVTGSSLTSVGALASGSIANGFGTIATANTITGTTINGTTGINTGASAGTQRIDASGNLVNIGTIDSTFIDASGNNVNLAASTNLQLNGTTVIDSARNLSNIAGVGTNLNPTANNTYSLGASGNQYANIYGQMLYQDGNQVCDTSGNCSGQTVTYWNQANGALSPKNSTVDFLLGGTATDAAKFAVLNINNGTPTASVSALATGATYMTAAGLIQTTANQSLTLGGNTTGNITLSPLNGGGIVTVNGDLTLASSKAYQINGATVLTATALGSSVVGSSLTSVGALTGGSIASGFGTIATANTITGTTINGTTGINTGAGAGTLRIDNNGNLSNISTINASGAITFSNLGEGIVKSSSGGLLSSSALNLASGTEITGTLTAGNGGTGFATYATGDLLVGNGSSTLSKLTAGGEGSILSISGGTPAWISSSSVNYWQRANGSLSPLNITDDLLLGGTSTASAKFAFINNIGAGTPTASISAGSNGATYLTAEGTLQTTANQTLSLGGNTTGNIVLNSDGNDYVGIGTTAPVQRLDIVGNLQIRDAEAQTKAYRFRTNGSGLDLEASGANLYLSNWSGADYTGTQYNYLVLESGASIARAVGTWQFRTSAEGTTRHIIDGSTGAGIVFNENSEATDFRIEGDADANALFVAGTSDRIGIGTNNPLAKFDIRGGLGTNSGTIPVASISGQTANAGLIVDNNGVGDLLTASKSGATKFAILNNGNIQINNLANCNTIDTDANGVLSCGTDADTTYTAGNDLDLTGTTFSLETTLDFVDTINLTGTGTLNGLDAIDATTETTIENAIDTLANLSSVTISGDTITDFTGTGLQMSGNTLTTTLGNSIANSELDNDTIDFDKIADNLTLDATTSIAVADFNLVLGTNTGTGTVVVQPNAGGQAALIVNKQGANDIFTASASGTTKFVIENDGDLRLTAGQTIDTLTNGTLGIGTTNATTLTLGRSGQNIALANYNNCGMLTTSGTTLTCSSAPAAATNYWQLNDGAISPFSNTLDLLVGSTATSSAKFAITGVAGTTTTASISGTTGAAYLNSSGTLQTTNNQTLSIGGSTTGNIILNSDGNNQVSIGTATPPSWAKLYVAGDVGATGNYVLADGQGFSWGDSSVGVNGHSGTDFLSFVTNSVSRMYINAVGSIGIGTASPLSTLDIRGNSGTLPIASLSGQTSHAGLIVDNNGVGDLFTASKSGATKFVINNAGNVGIGTISPTAMLDVAGAASVSGSLTFRTGAGSLQTTANNSLTIGGNTTGNIALTPLSGNGAIALNGDTTVAANKNLTLASGTGQYSQTFTGTTTDAMTITGNSLTTGRALYITSSNSLSAPSALMEVDYSGIQSAASLIRVDNSGVGSPTTLLDVVNSSVSSPTSLIQINNSSLGTPTNGLTITGNASGTIGTAINIATATVGTDIRLQNGETIDNNTDNQINLNLGSSGTFLLTNGSTLATSLTTFNLVNTTATTLNLAGAATDINIGAATGTTGINNSLTVGTSTATPLATLDVRGLSGTLPIASLSGQTSNAGLLVDNNGVGDLFTASKSGATKFVINNAGNVGVGTRTPSEILDIAKDGDTYLRLNALTGTGQSAGIKLQRGTTSDSITDYNVYANFGHFYIDQSINGSTSTALFIQDITKFVGIGTDNTSPLAQLDVRGTSGTLPIASFSGTTARAGLIVDNNGNGDLFTASKSGATKFVLKNNGDLQLANYNTAGGIFYGQADGTLALSAAGTSGQCLQSNGSGTPTWGSCDQASSVNNWTIANGLLYNSNLTTDVAIGGSASTSAKFLVSLSGTRPTASVSATTASAGLIVDNTIGDLFAASSSGLNRFVIKNNGNIGIGTALPTAKLHISGNEQTNRVKMFVQNTNSSSKSTALTLGVSSAIGVWELGTDYLNGNEDNLYLYGGGSGGLRLFSDSNGNFALGGNNTTPRATLDIRGNIGTIPIASVSGASTFAAMVVDQSGTGDLFTASKSGATKFTIRNSGVVVIGDNTNGITFDPLNSGLTYTGAARPTKQIILSPEYSGGIITASGSATTDGDFTADASASASTPFITLNGVGQNYLTYYEWNSQETSLQDYTVAVRVTLPADFSSWAPGGSSIQVLYNTELTTSDSSKVDMFLYPANTSTPTVYRQAQTSSTAKTWKTIDIPASDLNDGTPWNEASKSAMLYFKLSSKNNNHVQLGDIILNYLSRF